METNTPLVGTNGVVVLYPVTHVGLHPALIIHPGHTERVDLIRNHQPLNQIGLFKLRMLVVDILYRLNYLLNSLMILRLIGKTPF